MDEGMRVGPHDRISVIIRKEETPQRKGGVLTPGREPHQHPNSAGTLTWGPVSRTVRKETCAV